jgi:putative MATE family efflux protein
MISKYLGDRPFWKVLVRLALPVAIQNVLTSSFQLVDTLMVSNLGDVTLSAVGMAAQWGWLAAVLSFGLCSGMSVFVAQYWGVHDHKGIRRVLGMGLVTCLILSSVFLAVALAMPQGVVSLFNRDPEVIATGSRYLRIVCFSYPAVALTTILSAVLRNTERVKLPMYVSIVTTIANAFADYGLIFGKFGLPQLGVEGAAIATCISAWLGPVLIVLFSAFEKNLLMGPVRELGEFTLRQLGEFFSRALPVILNEGFWALGILVLNIIYSNEGYQYYAGMTIFRTFADLAFAFYVGLGNACVIMVGKSVGKGKIRRGVEDATRFTFLLPLAGVVIGGLTILFRYPLISIFSTGGNLSPVTLSTALWVTIFCSCEVAFRNIPYVQVVGVFRSGGDTLHGMLYDLGSLWLVSIPAALLAAYVFHWPFTAVVAAAYLGEDIPKCLLCLRHFFSMRWLKPVTPEGRAGLDAYRAEEAD